MKTFYIILLIGLFVLLVAMERVQKEKTGYQVATLMEDITFKEARNQYLRYKIGTYKSPHKVIADATEKKMQIANPADVIILRKHDNGPKGFKGKN